MKTAKILGVYKYPQYVETYIIEMLIPARPDSIDFSAFHCIDPSSPESDWQTAFGEIFLSEDGSTVLGDAYNKPAINDDKAHVIFGLYVEDFSIPLSTPYGEFVLSLPQKLPERLESIALSIVHD